MQAGPIESSWFDNPSWVGVAISAISALASILTFIAAAVYTYFTRQLLKESQRLTTAAVEPSVIAYLRPSARGGPWPELVFENVGGGVACDVNWAPFTDESQIERFTLGPSLRKATRDLGQLPPRAQRVFELVTENPKATEKLCTIRVSWRRAHGSHDENLKLQGGLYLLSVRDLDGLGLVADGFSNQLIAEELKRLTQVVHERLKP